MKQLNILTEPWVYVSVELGEKTLEKGEMTGPLPGGKNESAKSWGL